MSSSSSSLHFSVFIFLRRLLFCFMFLVKSEKRRFFDFFFLPILNNIQNECIHVTNVFHSKQIEIQTKKHISHFFSLFQFVVFIVSILVCIATELHKISINTTTTTTACRVQTLNSWIFCIVYASI